ncbi:CorA family divalent cation transporter [Prauserella endophytica]|uniref:CorA family divalent cation transporter n=1 Tax=Prauserella endophytica TaxID=1592324 RepID=UPI00197F039F|nr:CorA family divalent cation transporter [Prauserella endophytica]
MAWIGLYRPAEAQLMAAATQLGLHELAAEDAITAHQRPNLERYDDTLFIVLRSAHYHDDTEQVDFGELHLFVGAIPTGPWQDWAARLVPTLTLEAVIAWLDAGQPSPDHAADRIGHAIQGAIQAAQTD